MSNPREQMMLSINIKAIDPKLRFSYDKFELNSQLDYILMVLPLMTMVT
jgi:hypothetical protein